MDQPETNLKRLKIDVEWELAKANQRFMDLQNEITLLKQDIRSVNGKIARLKLTIKREIGEEPEEREEGDWTQIMHTEALKSLQVGGLTEMDALRVYEELKRRGVFPSE